MTAQTRGGSSLGGRLRTDRGMRGLLALCAGILIVASVAVFYFVASRGISTFTTNHVSIVEFLTGTKWWPDRSLAEGGPLVGILPYLVGSVLVCSLAVLLGSLFATAAAVFMTEIRPGLGERYLQPAVEVFAGIPSVVYGWVGLSILVPFVRNNLGGLGFSLLAGGLVLAIMILPSITSVSADSLKAVPAQLREASYALGATRWQTIRYVLLPAAAPGIAVGIVLGLARAFGEALAVQMVIGNRKVMPHSLLDQTTTLTSGITTEMGHSVMGSLWNNALWSMALVLLLCSFGFTVLVRSLSKRGAYR